MNKTRLVSWIACILVVLCVFVFFGWFWSLGAVQAGATPQITVEVVTPSVEWRRASEDAWKPLTEPVVILPGDRIRTGADGEARVTWGDRGYTRIDHATELIIESSPLDGTLTPGVEIRMQVVTGRIWSRMLKLLDLDSTVEVKTSDVVATVRGTTFGVSKDADGSHVTVTESVVEVSGKEGSTMLRDNQFGRFGLGALMNELRELGTGDAWAEENKRKDREDDVKFARFLRERSERLASELEGAPAFLVDASERLRLRVASPMDVTKLAALYGERRLARSITLGLDEDWNTLQRLAGQSGSQKGRLLGMMHAAVASRARLDGLNPLSRMRDMRRELADSTAAARTYLDALGIDERIDDVILLEAERTPERLQPIAEDLDIFESRMEHMEATEKEKDGLRRKAAALRKRLEYALTLAPGAAVEPTAPEVADPIQGTQILDTAKLTTPVLKPAPTPTPTPAPTTASYQRLTLLASPSTVDVGQAVRLTLFGITADGRTDDLTSKARFSIASGGSGTFSANVFTPSVAGTMTLNAAYTDQSGTRIAVASIVARAATAPVVTGLQSISIAFTGPTTLPCGGRSPFKVYAKYGDGKTQDVTMLSTFTVSDPKIIFASSDAVVSTFCAAQTTKATLTASYTENKLTKTASAVITLEPDPQPVSGPACTGRYCP